METGAVGELGGRTSPQPNPLLPQHRIDGPPHLLRAPAQPVPGRPSERPLPRPRRVRLRRVRREVTPGSRPPVRSRNSLGAFGLLHGALSGNITNFPHLPHAFSRRPVWSPIQGPSQSLRYGAPLPGAPAWRRPRQKLRPGMRGAVPGRDPAAPAAVVRGRPAFLKKSPWPPGDGLRVPGPGPGMLGSGPAQQFLHGARHAPCPALVRDVSGRRPHRIRARTRGRAPAGLRRDPPQVPQAAPRPACTRAHASRRRRVRPARLPHGASGCAPCRAPCKGCLPSCGTNHRSSAQYRREACPRPSDRPLPRGASRDPLRLCPEAFFRRRIFCIAQQCGF